MRGYVGSKLIIVEGLTGSGVYKVSVSGGKEFTVRYEDGELTINLFLNERTRLVRQAEKVFLAEGWHFEVSFEAADG